MGKRKRQAGSAGQPGPERGRLSLWISGGLCLAILVVVAAWTLLPRDATTGQAAQFRGGPRLALDQDLIDFGAVRYNQFVEARFRLTNVGDQPLQLPASPPVDIVEGC